MRRKEIYLSVLIYPLWSLYLSFKHYRQPQAKNLFWFFCVFMGMIHIFSPEGGSGADGESYAQRLIDLNQKPISWENFSSSFYEDRAFADIYQPTITYLLSIATKNPHWLFLSFAVVFGFFYSRNSWFILEKTPKKVGIPLFFLLFYYMLICPIWEINGVRMWTAFHVFAYGALPYLYNSDKSKLIWCFASLLIHFSYFLPLSILLIYHFIPKSITIFLSFYIFSFFVKELNLEITRDFFLSHAPSFLSSKAGYFNVDYAQSIIEEKSNANFYLGGSLMLVRWAISILIFASCVWGKAIIKTQKSLTNIICFSLFIYSICNILSSIPSLGRFIGLSQFFAFASIVLFYIHYINNNYKHKILSWTFNVVPLLLLLPIVVKLRMGTDYYGISLFLNPFMALFVEDNQPIIQFVKSAF